MVAGADEPEVGAAGVVDDEDSRLPVTDAQPA